ncbi:Uncharacterised protein [Mycobacteroides abscessus subsp. abscessus]|nr:Uncharacterised protein [Mycobacteroides abscessus subsp. abscessus]
MAYLVDIADADRAGMLGVIGVDRLWVRLFPARVDPFDGFDAACAQFIPAQCGGGQGGDLVDLSGDEGAAAGPHDELDIGPDAGGE